LEQLLQPWQFAGPGGDDDLAAPLEWQLLLGTEVDHASDAFDR
jgi:hypothetical protein